MVAGCPGLVRDATTAALLAGLLLLSYNPSFKAVAWAWEEDVHSRSQVDFKNHIQIQEKIAIAVLFEAAALTEHAPLGGNCNRCVC